MGDEKIRAATEPTRAEVTNVRNTTGSLRRQRSHEVPKPVEMIPCQNKSGGLVSLMPASDSRGSRRPDCAVTRAICR